MRRVPVGAVAFFQQAAIDEQAVAAGQTGSFAGNGEQARNQPADGGFAVTAGNADHRNAAVAVGKEMVDNGLPDRARFADAGLEVHQQAGAGVDFDDGAALFGERF